MKIARLYFIVVPAKAGTQGGVSLRPWIPACAGMTGRESVRGHEERPRGPSAFAGMTAIGKSVRDYD